MIDYKMLREEALKARKFNRRIEIIQCTCHVIGYLGVVAGFIWWLMTAGAIEVNNLSLTDAVIELIKGASVIGISALLVNM